MNRSNPLHALLLFCAACSPLHAQPSRLTSSEADALFVVSADKPTTFTDDADLISAVTPAVVSVFPARIVEDVDAENPLDQFFNRDRSAPKGKGGDTGSRENERVQGVGSGVVLSADGWIVTNSHVVHFNNGKLADAISIELPDHRRFDAEIVGADPLTDLALLKVKAKDLGFMRLADSDSVRVGHPVFAVGNPFKIGLTATKGMVSALNRSNLDLTTHGGFESYIQTDAAINPGNSGGALANRHGQLVGINTAIWAAGGRFNIGIGFAVPSNLVRHIVKQLAQHGKVARGFFGWKIEDAMRKDIETAGLIAMAGAKLGALLASGPAAAAGLKEGDIVIEAAGKPVVSRGDLRFLASLVKPGEKLSLRCQRAGQQITVTLTAAKEEAKAEAADGTFTLELIPGVQFRVAGKGITVHQLPKPIAAKTGLTTGMEILTINSKPCADAASAGAALMEGVNRLTTRIGTEEQTLAIRLPLEVEP